jgi:hypothetical protein
VSRDTSRDGSQFQGGTWPATEFERTELRKRHHWQDHLGPESRWFVSPLFSGLARNGTGGTSPRRALHRRGNKPDPRQFGCVNARHGLLFQIFRRWAGTCEHRECSRAICGSSAPAAAKGTSTRGCHRLTAEGQIRHAQRSPACVEFRTKLRSMSGVCGLLATPARYKRKPLLTLGLARCRTGQI